MLGMLLILSKAFLHLSCVISAGSLAEYFVEKDIFLTLMQQFFCLITFLLFVTDFEIWGKKKWFSDLAEFWTLIDRWVTLWKLLTWILVTCIASIYFNFVLGDPASFRSQRSHPNWFPNMCVSTELLCLAHCVWDNLNATQLILACLMVTIKKKVCFNLCWQ